MTESGVSSSVSFSSHIPYTVEVEGKMMRLLYLTQ